MGDLAREAAAGDEIRRHVRVRGQVQGVGFRPFVYRLARELGLSGWVRNDGEGVEIEVQGPPRWIDKLLQRLPLEAPGLARIGSIESCERPIEYGAADFRIGASGAGAARAEAAPDVGTCSDCLIELFDPANRRYRYPFINCTQCGPRYTIIRGLPYDRRHTSMERFTQCADCLAEYEAAASRRFHAEPNACPRCGPRLGWCDAGGRPLAVADVVAEALTWLGRGEILAIKGLGGFHLACDARRGEAVARLRARKQREEKPFAVMVANAASAGAFVQVDRHERVLLEMLERPIVLLRKRPGCDEQLPGVAPGLAWLGVMLPYTPLHYLLFHEAAGRPAGRDWLRREHPLALVMTSANPGGEPLVTGNEEALRRLSGIADAFVLHDRDIVIRCDDSVVRREGSEPARDVSAASRSPPRVEPAFQFIRRARGFTPQAIDLAHEGPSVLACGPFLKNTVCLTRGAQAFVSQHIGDLDNGATCVALEETVGRLMALLEIEPEIVAHDLHSDFFSSHYAVAFAHARGLPALGVQHHHAHIAAVMAEHRLEGDIIGLALDGVGLGTDASAWGGELLRVSDRTFERLGHLRPLLLPGGDKAAREPWRMAAAALFALGRGDEIKVRFAYPASKALPLMLDSGVHTPPTTSAGRWFDAAAGLADVKDFASFEGQAAMLYEGLAERYGPASALRDGFSLADSGELDLLPLLGHLADEPDAGRAAAVFHATLIEALGAWAGWAARREGIRRVALGGGCFLNHVLSRGLRDALERQGVHVVEARRVPPNDGGISLGQAWVAMQAQR